MIIPRLVSFLGSRSRPSMPSLGLLVGPASNFVIDVGQLLTSDVKSAGLKQGLMSELIDDGAWQNEQTRDFIDSLLLDHSLFLLPEHSVCGTEDVRLLAPVAPPRNVICVGKNYTDHIAEVAAVRPGDEMSEAPQHPVFFTKAPQCVIGDGEGFPAHAAHSAWLDYEVELAVVMGKSGVNIAKMDVQDHIFGYTIANDVTARELQKSHKQWFKGKSLDRTCPMGPCIVPATHLDASDLSLKAFVNGELRQDSRTSKMVFDIPTIVESLSAGFTLLPGDCILTGTPDGVGFAMKPPQVLKAGDEMTMEIEHIGRLTNTVTEG